MKNAHAVSMNAYYREPSRPKMTGSKSTTCWRNLTQASWTFEKSNEGLSLV